MYRGDKEEAMVRLLRTRSNVLLLLEHGLLRLSVPTVTLADAHANVFSTVRILAAGDAQTFNSASHNVKRTESLEWIGVSPRQRFNHFKNLL